MITHRRATKFTVVILILTLVITTILVGSDPVLAAEVPSGKFKPAEAKNKQGDYKSDKYYIYYNGDINTKMIDAGNKANDDEGAFEKATTMVTLDQEIVYIDNPGVTQTLNQWIAAEETAKTVDIGSANNEGDDAVWINLKKATVIPGLHDSHLHFENGGARRYAPNIFWKPLAEIQIIIKQEVAKAKAGDWITANGWNQTLDTWDGGKTDFPTKEDLDSVAPANPVVLTRTDGHANWANTIAIRMSPYGGATKSGDVVTMGPEDPAKWPINNPSDPLYANPTGGTIIRDAKGMATGVFIDASMGKVTENRTSTSNADPDRNALSANSYLLSYGLTSFMDAGTSANTVARYQRLYDEGKMKPRGYILLSVAKNGTADVDFRAANPTDIVMANGKRLTVTATKSVLDGALGSRGATLNEPYSDAGSAEVPDGHKGATLRFTDNEIYDIMKRNLDAGWNLGGHAIGDAANDQYLDALDKYLSTEKGLVKDTNGHFDATSVEAIGLRPRIEHYQILTKGAIERSASMNLTASVQFVHATSDMSMAGERVGEARLQYSYAWRKMVNNGMVIANGTDWAVDLLNPYHNLSAAVTRMDRDGDAPKSPRGVGVPWNPITTKDSKASDERMTRAEALHYSSWGGAYSEFQETTKGSLELGKLADFVVLDRDYFDESETEDSDIKDINALMTVVGGEICYVMKKPTILTDIVGAAKIGAPYAFTVTGDTDYSPTFDWSITSRDSELKWLKIDYHSGVLSGTPKKAGTYEFDVTARNYLGSDTVTLSITVNDKDVAPPADKNDLAGAVVTGNNDVVYDGKAKTPAINVSLNGNALAKDVDYTVAYKDNVKVGKASIIITAKGDKYTGTKTVNFNIKPKKQKIASTKPGKKSLTVKWKKDSQVTGYQVVIGTNKKITKGKKTANIKKNSTIKKKFTKLKKGKVYYVKIRAYKTIDGKKVYGAWSTVKKTKKIK